MQREVLKALKKLADRYTKKNIHYKQNWILASLHFPSEKIATKRIVEYIFQTSSLGMKSKRGMPSSLEQPGTQQRISRWPLAL
jgi:hypothetical protein